MELPFNTTAALYEAGKVVAVYIQSLFLAIMVPKILLLFCDENINLAREAYIITLKLVLNVAALLIMDPSHVNVVVLFIVIDDDDSNVELLASKEILADVCPTFIAPVYNDSLPTNIPPFAFTVKVFLNTELFA